MTALAQELYTQRLLLRPPAPLDQAPIEALLSEPDVARFWPGYDAPRVAELLAGDDETTPLVVTSSDRPDRPIGVIQYSQEGDPQYRHAGIDLFLGTAWHGRGLGQEAIRAVLRRLFGALGHHRVTIDPAADNARALRAYEAVGFRRVGLLRQYERRPDGLHDGVLLELLAQDYRDPADAPRPDPPRCRPALRRATLQDLQRLLAMMVAFNQGERIQWDPVTGEAPLRRLVEDPGLGLVALITLDEDVAGYAIATYGYDLEFGGRDAVLTELYLVPAARGQGLGRHALDQLAAALRGQGVSALHLQVRPDNTAGLRLYLSAGFVATTRHFMTLLLPGPS